MIPNAAIDLGPDAEALVLEVIRSGQVAQGPMVERLEAGFRSLTGAEHAIAVSSGTAALVLAMEALELSPGAEVITSPFTFVATLNAILEAGATATFADIGDDFTISPAAIAAAATDRTEAILPVHLYGLPAAMHEISAFAQRRGLHLIEDAAQAHGASCSDQMVGTFGVGCFSLYATKNITSGEGGVITCDDHAIADRIRLLRNQGMRVRYEYEIPGHNCRLTDLQAALAVSQLPLLAARTERRRRNADLLTQGLAGIEGIVLPFVPPERTHVWHQYTVRVTPDARLDRDELAARLAERGIGSGVYYPRAVFDYDCYRSHPRVRIADVPNAMRAAKEVLSLPVHASLNDGDIAKIVDAVRELAA